MRVEKEVLREAQRLIVRHEVHGRMLAEEHVRRTRRSTAPTAAPKLRRPAHWDTHPGFDPYLTRAHSSRISHSIRDALRRRRYRPRHPCGLEVAKEDGGHRRVCIYQVADSAISKMLYEGILRKNLPLMSARSYAYRSDLSAQNAIQYVQSEFRGKARLYVAEYDFSSYFDKIEHEHIRRILRDHFLLTQVEWQAIEAFLTTGPSPATNYTPLGGPARTVGVPQGTSISLFLANVAAWELDRALEGEGVRFVRYADDTLIWSTDYARLCSAVELLHSHAGVIGASVNQEKSPGIHLLVGEGVDGEMATIHAVDYLGHQFSTTATRLKPSAEQRIKNRIDQLVFNTLLREPMRGTQNMGRIVGAFDRDYLILVMRLRRYLYGDLSERALRRYQTRGAPLRHFKGVMSAYPLVDDLEALAALDSWLLDRVWLAVRKRGRLLQAAGSTTLPIPYGKTRAELTDLAATSSGGATIDLSLPSVRRIADVISTAARRYGPSHVGQFQVY